MVVFELWYCYACAMRFSDFSYQGDDYTFMALFFKQGLPRFWRKGSTLFLAFFWFLGLAFGILFFLLSGDSFVSLMRGTLTSSVSIIRVLCVSLLPFLLSAFAVFISEPRLLLLICFGKAFLFSFVSFGVIQAFGSAGWLVRWLLLFSDCASVPVLYWFWLRNISGNSRFCFWEICGFLSMELLIGSIDYCLVSPFLARLLDF